MVVSPKEFWLFPRLICRTAMSAQGGVKCRLPGAGSRGCREEAATRNCLGALSSLL